MSDDPTTTTVDCPDCGQTHTQQTPPGMPGDTTWVLTYCRDGVQRWDAEDRP